MAKIYDVFYYNNYVYSNLDNLIFYNSDMTLKDVDKVCAAKITLCNVLDCCEKLARKWSSAYRALGIAKEIRTNNQGVTLETREETYYYKKENKTSKVYDKRPLASDEKQSLSEKIIYRDNKDATVAVCEFIQSVICGLSNETGVEARLTTRTLIDIDFIDKSLSIKESNKKMEQLLEIFYATCRICLHVFGVDVDCSDAERQLKVYHRIEIKSTKIGDGQDLYKFVFENKHKQDLQDLQLTILNPSFEASYYFIENKLFKKKTCQENNPNIIVLNYSKQKERELLSDCRHTLLLENNMGVAVVAYKNIRDIAKLLDNDAEKIAKMLLEAESKEN